MKCGFIAIAGLPNAGKSTLLNSLVGQKIAGVSARKQTTRHKILGIVIEGDAELLFVDTPGIHKVNEDSQRLNVLMNRTAWASIHDADLVCYALCGIKGPQPADHEAIAAIRKRRKNLVILITKIDQLKKNIRKQQEAKVRQLLALPSEEYSNTESVAVELVSAKQKESLQALKKSLADKVPEGPWLYSDDQISNRDQRFLVAELIREQAFRYLSEEIPYGLTVHVEKWQGGHSTVTIMARIVVTRDSHKGIVIGRGGAMIKMLGSKARPFVEELVGQQVNLKLNVEVKKNWHQSDDLIFELGGADGFE